MDKKSTSMTRFDKWLFILAFALLFWMAQDRYCKYLNTKHYDWPKWVYQPILKYGERYPTPFTEYEYYVVVDGKRHDIKQARTIEYDGRIFKPISKSVKLPTPKKYEYYTIVYGKGKGIKREVEHLECDGEVFTERRPDVIRQETKED